jgi:hypothetical protein
VAVTLSDIVFYKFGIIVKEIGLELMAGDESGSDGLLFEQHFRLLGVDQDQRFFVVVFLHLVLRAGIDKDTRSCPLSRIAPIGNVKVDFVPLTVFPSLGEWDSDNYGDKDQPGDPGG